MPKNWVIFFLSCEGQPFKTSLRCTLFLYVFMRVRVCGQSKHWCHWFNPSPYFAFDQSVVMGTWATLYHTFCLEDSCCVTFCLGDGHCLFLFTHRGSFFHGKLFLAVVKVEAAATYDIQRWLVSQCMIALSWHFARVETSSLRLQAFYG